ncbi:MAG TPA: hypothetical protein PLZ36_00295, partial [Armatimonadota bacterium]|nr:hypothetical protein [Armatimonadota bacterium]
TRMRNSLHRLTNTTTGPDGAVEDSGALFTMPVAYTPHICIYAKIADDFLTEAEALFADLEHWGFGKHASIGLGAVSCEEHWFEECPELRCAGEANGFVALSHFAPAREDPTDGRWRLLVKYGKFGDTRATTIPSGSDDAQPFKRPVIMLEAGATFRCHPVRPWYGRLLAGLSAYYSDARQYAYCYAVPCRV